MDIRGAWLNPGTFPEALKLVSRMANRLARLQTRSFSLDEMPEALLCAQRPEVNKVFIRP